MELLVFTIAVFNFERIKQHVHSFHISMPNYCNFSACKIKAFEQQSANFDKLQNFQFTKEYDHKHDKQIKNKLKNEKLQNKKKQK